MEQDDRTLPEHGYHLRAGPWMQAYVGVYGMRTTAFQCFICYSLGFSDVHSRLRLMDDAIFIVESF